jgi:hypothetical protein
MHKEPPLTAEIGSVSNTWNSIRDLVNHVVARIRVIFLDQLVTGRTLLSSAISLPSFQTIIYLVHGTTTTIMPRLLAHHTESLDAVRALDTGNTMAFRWEIYIIIAEDAAHPFPIRRSIGKFFEFIILSSIEEPLRCFSTNHTRTRLIMHRALHRKQSDVPQRTVEISFDIFHTECMAAPQPYDRQVTLLTHATFSFG